MNWTPIFASLKQLAGLSGLDQGAIVWSSQASANKVIMGTRLVMKVFGVHGVGMDWERRQDNPDGGQTVTMVGNRHFTWQIRAESMNADPATMGLAPLEMLRTRLERSSTQPMLRAGNLAVVELRPTVEVSERSQDRKVSAHMLEVVMATMEYDADTTSGSGDFIDHVHVTSEFTQPDGTAVSPQIDETIGPPPDETIGP